MESLLTYAAEGREPLQRRVPVLIPVLLDATYDYLVPAEMELKPGDFVLVPFGPQQRIGIVWHEAGENTKPVDEAKLKEVIAPLDVPPLPMVSLEFSDWVARYTLTPRGMVAKLAMSAPAAFESPKPRFGVRMAGEQPARLTQKRARVVAIAQDGLVRAKGDLAKAADVGTGVVDGLVKAGTLVACEIPDAKLPQPDPGFAVPEFEGDQLPGVHTLRAAGGARSFSVSLLDGVTGSGKTEVYFEAMAAAMEAGRQVLVLLPEIALTTQFIKRFAARFGCRPLEWHSAVAAGERGRIWKSVANGEAKAVIGARSALFLPFKDLGLIVVDEEHDPGYKQEDRVTYQARDMAVVRASLGHAGVVLASATPSIESHVNARTGRYRHIRLTRRYSDALLPDVRPIDMRKAPPSQGSWLSPVLVQAMTQTRAAGQQSLLFLNRRGYAPLTLCRACGHRFQCPQCSAWLVEHRFRGRLTCHHCGFNTPLPKQCPGCEKRETLVPIGPGVERIAEEVRETWPGVKLAILSSDLTPGMTEMRAILQAITDGEAEIVIGTQMVAKGHHFPGLQTVGVVDADLGLSGGGGDLRASERTFQLLSQVIGRAGREGREGRGFVQTYHPDHPVMEAIVSGDREAFLEQEILGRQMAQMPPFGRLVALIVSARQKSLAEEYARLVARSAPPARNISVLGPVEAPIAVIRGRHRYRILVKAPKEVDVQAYLRAWLDGLPKRRGDLRLAVDIDPYSFL